LQNPGRVKPAFSHWLASYTLLSHVFFMIAFICTQAPWWLIFITNILCLLSLCYRWKRDVTCTLKTSIIDVTPPISTSGKEDLSQLKQPLLWELTLGNGQIIKATLRGSTRVLSWIVILHFGKGFKRYYLPIFFDALNPDQFRRLKVYLRMECKKVMS
jgi:hypothetical protein